MVFVPTSIPDERFTLLNHKEPNPRGQYVLYWMDASLRQRRNSALEFAIALGNDRRRDVVVLYCLSGDRRINTYRRARFVLESLSELKNALINRGIQLVVLAGTPQRNVPHMAAQAVAVVTDKGYLRQDRQTCDYIAQRIDCSMIQVEDNVVVPVETASGRQEYSARTFRPRINARLERFLSVPSRERPALSSLKRDFLKLDLDQQETLLRQMRFVSNVPACPSFPGGELAAQTQWKRFLNSNLIRYDLRRNLSAHATSMMSPYLAFGCISPVEMVLDLREYVQHASDSDFSSQETAALSANVKIFQEELVVRRELAVNYVWYNPLYDTFDGLPSWAQNSLESHAPDERADLYSPLAMEAGKTLDVYWNRMQRELAREGWLPPHARMYWGKQPLLWTRDPAEAFELVLKWNDKYELDGMSPGGFTGVGWCYGLHDLPFHNRPIWGYIRPMSRSGLEKSLKQPPKRELIQQ